MARIPEYLPVGPSTYCKSYHQYQYSRTRPRYVPDRLAYLLTTSSLLL
jgi:hypothetical protein